MPRAFCSELSGSVHVDIIRTPLDNVVGPFFVWSISSVWFTHHAKNQAFDLSLVLLFIAYLSTHLNCDVRIIIDSRISLLSAMYSNTAQDTLQELHSFERQTNANYIIKLFVLNFRALCGFTLINGSTLLESVTYFRHQARDWSTTLSCRMGPANIWLNAAATRTPPRSIVCNYRLLQLSALMKVIRSVHGTGRLGRWMTVLAGANGLTAPRLSLSSSLSLSLSLAVSVCVRHTE